MSKIEFVQFEKAFINVPVGKHKIQQKGYLQNGICKIVDQGKSLIAGYCNEIELLKSDIPYILFGDHTKIVKFIDFPFVVGADGVRLYKASAEFNPKFLFYYLKNAKLPSDNYGRHSKYLDILLIPKIPKDQQNEIVELLELKLEQIERARKANEIKYNELNILPNKILEAAFNEIENG